jgi:hypothetical protein
MVIESNDMIPPGKHVLWRNGKPVWMGSLGAPIEDVECDKIQVNPADYERIKAATSRTAT